MRSKFMHEKSGEFGGSLSTKMYRVIPSLATPGFVSVEGVETMLVTPKNNPTHERPAPQIAGDEIVRTLFKDREVRFKRLYDNNIVMIQSKKPK